MNWQHFRAFLWLRYRLMFNRIRRQGTVATVITTVAIVFCLFQAVLMFVGGWLCGLYLVPKASPLVHLLIWDGMTAVFLFLWLVVLMSDLQRTEPLSLDKFLHLPVSLTGAFVVNYLSSVINLRIIVFAPMFVGLMLGLAGSRSPLVLLGLPLLAAFLFMVTAMTHQLQGWLASLMTNPRRRRSVVVFFTLAVVLLIQAPNLVMQFTVRKGARAQVAANAADQQARMEQGALEAQSNDLSRKIETLQIQKIHVPEAEYLRRHEELTRALADTNEKVERYRKHNAEQAERKKQEDAETWQYVGETARVVNWVFPPAWLPLGVTEAAEGDALPAILGTLGLGLIGTVSLWRSYRTTKRIYTGQLTSGRKRAAKVEAPAPTPGQPRELLLEKKIPWISEQAAAIALAGFRSLVRAPEAKMLLLMPVILVAIFGSMFVTRSEPVPEGLRPLLAFGALAMVMLSMIGFLGNQFGFDRTGFRVFVLCGARRRDILLGKNLAFVPYTAALGGITVFLLQCLFPMPPDLFLAVLPQAVAMYLVLCALANWLSILAPLAIPAGAMRPTNVKVIPVLIHMAFVFLFPVVLAPTLLPLGIEYALSAMGWMRGWPVCLVLMTVECAIIVLLYSLILSWQGYVLQRREQRILEIVTAKAE